MHFVTGGAFNGKRKWVKAQYSEAEWISAYHGEELLEEPDAIDSPLVVLEGLETWVKEHSLTREKWRIIIERWLRWEQEEDSRQLIIIGTDISKGIVPIEKEHRNWRDLTGWVYQDVVASCERVDVIWYGINQKMKG